MGRWVRANNMKPNTPLPSIVEIAGLAKVSARTADLALRELVKDGVCFRRPKKGTYVAEEAKRGRMHKRIIGLYTRSKFFTPDCHSFASAVYDGILGGCRDLGATSALFTDALGENMDFFLDNGQIDYLGTIFMPHAMTASHEEMFLKRRNVRFVQVNTRFREFAFTPDNVMGVFNDEFSGGYQAAEFLIREGRTRFSLMGYRLLNENYALRVKGFLQACADRRIGVDPRSMSLDGELECSSQSGIMEYGRRTARRMLEAGTLRQAVFCVNDILAAGVADFLRERGLYPGKTAICGYDNIHPHLSNDRMFPTLAVDFEKMGRLAVDLLIRDGKTANKSVFLHPALIPRRV